MHRTRCIRLRELSFHGSQEGRAPKSRESNKNQSKTAKRNKHFHLHRSNRVIMLLTHLETIGLSAKVGGILVVLPPVVTFAVGRLGVGVVALLTGVGKALVIDASVFVAVSWVASVALDGPAMAVDTDWD